MSCTWYNDVIATKTALRLRFTRVEKPRKKLFALLLCNVFIIHFNIYYNIKFNQNILYIYILILLVKYIKRQ